MVWIVWNSDLDMLPEVHVYESGAVMAAAQHYKTFGYNLEDSIDDEDLDPDLRIHLLMELAEEEKYQFREFPLKR